MKTTLIVLIAGLMVALVGCGESAEEKAAAEAKAVAGAKAAAEAMAAAEAKAAGRAALRYKAWLTKTSVTSSGTGFFVTDDGYLLTNHHVVKGGRYFSIKTGKVVLPAKVVVPDPQNDLALLKVDVNYLPLLKVEGKLAALPLEHDLRKVALGDKVLTVGFPLTDTQGFKPKLTEGSISSLSGIKDHPGELQISVPIQPGNSGGPLVNEYGNVVGIVVSTLNAVYLLRERGIIPQNVNYAVKSSLAIPLMNAFNRNVPGDTPVADLDMLNPEHWPLLRITPNSRKPSDVAKEVVAATVLIQVRTSSSPPPVEKPFASEWILWAVRKAAGKPTGELTKADLEKMTELNLADKKLTELPKVLENLTQLTYLNLSWNELTDVKGLEKLTKLTGLYLMRNPDLTKAQIAELQKALPKCRIEHNAKK